MNFDPVKMSAEQEALLAEFQSSGLSAEEFIRKYLTKKGVADPEKVIREISSTLSEIDRNYAEIKRAKEKGSDRKSYLREICDKLFSHSDSRKAARALEIVTNGLTGKEDSASSLEYDGVEAASLISNLDDAIVISTLAGLSGGEDKDE